MSPDHNLPIDRDDGGPDNSLATFFDLSAAVGLSEAEIHTLLDVPAEAVAALRSGAPGFAELDQPKLQRRLGYAISILRRMLAARSGDVDQ